MPNTAAPSHIIVDEAGHARIDGTGIKVRVLIQVMKAWYPTIEALHEAYPQLTLGQIHSALAYYYDHQAEFDAEIERLRKLVDEHQAASEETPGRKKLRDMGLRP